MILSLLVDERLDLVFCVPVEVSKDGLGEIGRIVLFLHEIRVLGHEQLRINIGAEASFGEVDCLAVDAGELDADLGSCKLIGLPVAIRVHEMAVVDLPKLLVVEVVDEEVEHVIVLNLFLILCCRFGIILLHVIIYQVDLIGLFGNESRFPGDEEIVPVQIAA